MIYLIQTRLLIKSDFKERPTIYDQTPNQTFVSKLKKTTKKTLLPWGTPCTTIYQAIVCSCRAGCVCVIRSRILDKSTGLSRPCRIQFFNVKKAEVSKWRQIQNGGNVKIAFYSNADWRKMKVLIKWRNTEIFKGGIYHDR